MEKSEAAQGSVAIEEEKKEEQTQPEIIRFMIKPRQEVSFAVGTIDNENMGKRKSKVCCIYNKPHALDSSSSSDEHDDHDGHGHSHGKDGNRYDKLPKHQRRKMREMVKEQKEQNDGQGHAQ